MATRKKLTSDSSPVARLAARIQSADPVSAEMPAPDEEIKRLFLALERAMVPFLAGFSVADELGAKTCRRRPPTKEKPARNLDQYLSESQIASVPLLLKCYSRLGTLIRQMAGDHAFRSNAGIAQSALRILIDQSCSNVEAIHGAAEGRVRVFGSQRFKFPVMTASPVVERTTNAQLKRAGVGANHIGLDGRSRQSQDRFRDAAEHFILLLNFQMSQENGQSLYDEIATWPVDQREKLWVGMSRELRREKLPRFLENISPEEDGPSRVKKPAKGGTLDAAWGTILLGVRCEPDRPLSKHKDRVKEIVLERMKTALGLRQLKH